MKITRFTTTNGQRMIKIVTESGVTGYVDSAIPLEALAAWRMRLYAQLKRPDYRLRRDVVRRRRGLIPVRQQTRRLRRHSRVRLHTRRIRLVRRQ